MAARLHYLTVQDMLWINHQTTGKVNRFDYAKLEEATYYQYAYGESKQVVAQAGRFISGFIKMAPFETGNAATALIGCLAFLSVNGIQIELKEKQALDWFASIRDRTTDPIEAINSVVGKLVDQHQVPDVRMTVRGLLGDYSSVVAKL